MCQASIYFWMMMKDINKRSYLCNKQNDFLNAGLQEIDKRQKF
jgi:hypothetical protein